MGKVQRWVFKCDACGHEWIPDGERKPERCPDRKCRSRKWDAAKVEKPRETQKPTGEHEPGCNCLLCQIRAKRRAQTTEAGLLAVR